MAQQLSEVVSDVAISQKSDVKKRSLIMVWTGLLLVTLVGLTFFYQLQSKAADDKAYSLLQSVAESKAALLEGWLGERYANLMSFTGSIAVADLYPHLGRNSLKLQDLEKWVEVFNLAYGYENFTLIDAQGQIISSLGDSDIKMTEHIANLIEKSQTDRAVQTQLFTQDGIFHLDFVAPIIDRRGKEPKYLGSIVLHMNPVKFIVPMLTSWPVVTESGRTELIFPDLNLESGRGVVHLVPVGKSEVRLESLTDMQVDKMDLITHSDDHPKQTEVLKIARADGQTIFRYHTHLTSVNWVLTTSISQDEAYKNLNQNLIILATGLMLGLSLIAFIFLRTLRSEHVRVKNEQLKKSQSYFMGLFMNAPIAYQSLNMEGRLLEVNEAWLALFGYQQSDLPSLVGRPISQFMAEASVKAMEGAFSDFFEVGSVNNITFSITTKAGEVKEVEVTRRISLDSENRKRTHCMLVDVTEQRRADQQLRLSAKVLSSAGEGVMVTNSSGEIISINQAFTKILGYKESDVIGKTPRILQSGKHSKEFYAEMWVEVIQNGIWQGEIWNRHKKGCLVPEWLTITALNNSQGEIENYIGVFADITKLKASQAELDYLAHHDVLTNLSNRRKFLINLEFVLKHTKRSQEPIAVLMLDLDRFKDVNDSYGHAAGDEVLLNTASILKNSVSGPDMVARLGGDEFVVLLEGLQQTSDAAKIASTIISAISKPQVLKDSRVVSVGCSIGIALYPQHGDQAELLMQHADSALYLAKKNRGTFGYFTADMTASAQQRMAVEAELKLALNNSELRVFYQPQVVFDSGQIKGVESLVRWQHPEKGLLTPAYFIEVAEESGLIADIGKWVLYETCRQAKVWYDLGYTKLVYAVNVSPKQLAYSDFLSVVMDVLQQTGLPAECLELEITESGLLSVDKQDAVELFESLRGLGVSIAIDDFGTGYSSLSYLKTLPLDVLKVDKSFVDDIPHNEQGMQIVNTIISMGHNLGFKVLAEGVEEEVQKRFLQLKGCDFYQGYLMSPALPADEFLAFYQQHQVTLGLSK